MVDIFAWCLASHSRSNPVGICVTLLGSYDRQDQFGLHAQQRGQQRHPIRGEVPLHVNDSVEAPLAQADPFGQPILLQSTLTYQVFDAHLSILAQFLRPSRVFYVGLLHLKSTALTVRVSAHDCAIGGITMKWMILAGVLLAPAAASAQGVSEGSTIYLGACKDAPPPTTQHKWTVTAPGVLALGGTAFTITADRTRSGEFALTYTLFWKKQNLLTSEHLNDCEMLGLAKAVDLQATGAPME
jgi:hypothetical protein